MQSSRCFMGYRCLLLLAFMTLMPSFAICEEKNSASVAESEKRNENEWVFLLTPEFRRKVEKFKISPLEAAIILFREYNREVTSVEKLRGISDFGSLRCIKGNDYVFSLTPYIPKKGVLMDGIYLDGFTGEYRTILYSENHRDKYVKIPQFGLCYFSIPCPLAPEPAKALEFSWNGMSDLPYSYDLDEPEDLKEMLLNDAGADKLNLSTENWLKTTY